MVVMNLIKFNDKDKRVLLQGKEFYYGILIEAPTAIVESKILSTFLNNVNKPFVLDPSTYYFHPELNTNEDRPSLVQLREKYGLSEEEFVLYPEDFTEEFAKNFTKNVLNFQANHFASAQKGTLLKYITRDQILKPAWYIPPYFPIENFNDPWVEVNIKLMEYATDFFDNIFPIIGILEKDTLLDFDEKLLRDFIKRIPSKMLGLWIAEFDKKSISEEYLRGYYQLVEEIKQYKKGIILMYANFFDIMPQPYGIAHGICGGDLKYVGSGGGKEYVKMYIPFLRREFTLEKATAILARYGDSFGYSATKEMLDTIRTLNHLDKKYSTLKEKGKTPKGFRISQLSEKEKEEYKEIEDKIRHLKDTIKMEFLKERNHELRELDVTSEINNIKRTIEAVYKRETSTRVAKYYVGHLERWIAAIQEDNNLV
ncbi:hypothetical protein [Thermococcus sp.]|uniref:hypothetical protein n=1 Tax=Thermococcus sp. TaxID=35749 RepID=UPI0019AB89B5|nr:hypothetical protein [Thermococcus sp.]MBC7094860.1 hypothetical protein [Thermococcus sp.]